MNRHDTPAEAAADPRCKPIGYQSWHDLLFVHWRLPTEICQQSLPAGLTVDTRQGEAWLGLIAFYMSGVRPSWFPAVPYLSRFAETNLRTYVRCESGEPGIWFFSLEAARLLAVLAARAGWQLPYHWAHMSCQRQGNRLRYASRRWLDRSNASTSITAEILQSDEEASPATSGTLEEFLVERYVFYNLDRRGQLQQGRVRHRPYPLLAAQLIECQQSLCAASGLAVAGPAEHIVFSPGLEVEIVGLGPVEP